jgi:hypothetical protein
MVYPFILWILHYDFYDHLEYLSKSFPLENLGHKTPMKTIFRALWKNFFSHTETHCWQQVRPFTHTLSVWLVTRPMHMQIASDTTMQGEP